jgi:hypothetical protein
MRIEHYPAPVGGRPIQIEAALRHRELELLAVVQRADRKTSLTRRQAVAQPAHDGLGQVRIVVVELNNVVIHELGDLAR